MLSKKKFVFLTILILIFTLLPNVCVATDSMFVWSNSAEAITTSVEAEAKATGNFLNLQSGSAILIEQNSGKVLYEHNSHEQLRPASVTKIMSILLIMEALDSGSISLEDTVPCSENASNMGGSQIWLDPTEELTVDAMLKAICVVSANDCCVAMAEFLCGSQELFVEQMNKRAKELGMNDTTFKNCHGIDEDGHLTSSYDIAIMSKELMNNHPSITKYTTIWMDSLRDGKSELVNTNKLIRNYSGATGLKTGSTSIALYNLSATATRNDLSLIAVIMKAPTTATRFNEAKQLLDYGFSTYSYKKFANKNDIVNSVIVEKGTASNVNVVFDSDVGNLVKKGQEKSISQNINLKDVVIAPVYKGQKLGEVTFCVNNETIGVADLVAENDVHKLNLWNMTTKLYKEWFNLCN